MIGSTLAGLLITLAAIAAAVLALVFIAVPVFKGVGSLLGGGFRAIGWLIAHLVEFVFGVLSDVARCLGAVPALLIFSALALVNVLIGRWSAASHFGDAVGKECRVGAACLYRALLRRPLKLVWLHGVLEGVEQRVPEVWDATPGSDTPGRATGQFAGYTIVGSLRAGGSGAKLYVAKPDDKKRAMLPTQPDVVVIKSFALTDGSSLPQIIRESRALECAKRMGHVLDHGLDAHRFHYVMPYIPGDNLGIVTRRLHGESDATGLSRAGLDRAMAYAEDLVRTLDEFHQQGLWHKDVKPENVIIHEDRAQIVDLGLLTPLQSAMTLTTHGTEYFRDPEMVRQAIRGVKVHQVDGAKFDIYGAGAVLYFMLENTFPAHGGLSAFSRRAPESLRWIVKRAMADYSKRYPTAADMLADLHFVRSARDPWGVRPADLPSMRGSQGDVEIAAAQPASFTPGPASPMAAQGARPMAAAAKSTLRRPSLRVTDWMTGAYSVDPATWDASARADVHTPAARRPAAEQLHAARLRARELTQQARARVQQQIARRHSRVPKILWAIGILALLVPAGIIFSSLRQIAVPGGAPIVASGPISSIPQTVLVITSDRDADDASQKRALEACRKSFGPLSTPVMDSTPDLVEWAKKARAGDSAAVAELNRAAAMRGSVGVIALLGHRDLYVHRTSLGADAPPPAFAGRVLVVNSHPVPAATNLIRRVDSDVAALSARGFEVVHSDADAAAALSIVLPRWEREPGAVQNEVEDLLEAHGYSALLWVYAVEGEGPTTERVATAFVASGRPGAVERLDRDVEVLSASDVTPAATEAVGSRPSLN